MEYMADGPWNWCVAGRWEPDRVMGALAGALERPVHGMIPGADLLCDVYHAGGDFPTLVDVYVTPAGVAEETIASAVAVRLGAAVLLPDDTLNPSRYVLAEPDGSLRAVHVDEVETDDGPERRNVRPCTGADPACAAPAGCDRSRWKPGPTPERPAAA
ncbi:hypothetical protein FHR83_000643 [Actinoplanes campanulatus]|uniref:Uncharacterized protein n=1 Tax=Actinoplanes campanulatus TaxID=113559 RepID=A0A7W5FC28_9ACTN|nr:hypothetical protein [Actinoplanes campanulatus]MBB3093009.1 hypothetical protein [Actinoplanes campanulatus]GGN00513.1 hypothetical protein GCM10010109_05710 [Actinoplanes campanulatus]GID33895.1 hypothetical protein Aca09nite_04010 [Actinoplanes campanulatus]